MTSRDQSGTAQLVAVHVFAIGAGAMFSSGFFLLPGVAAAETGPSVPLAYLLAGILVLPTMLSVIELAVAMPRAGGPYHFFRRAFGPTLATIGGLGLWIALTLKSAFALVGIDVYLSIVLELPSGAVGLVLAGVFTGLNLVGARETAALQVGLVALLLVVLGGFIVAGGFDLAGSEADRFEDAFSPLFTDGALGLLAATGVVFVAFAGLPQVASVAGEIRNPTRSIPRGVLWALGVATTVYVLGTAVLVVTIPGDELQGDPTPIATSIEAIGVPFGVPLIVAAALAAFASTANAGVLSASRYPVALARDKMLWERFGRLRSGTPMLSVIASGIAVAVVVTIFDVESIAKLGSAVVLGSFGLLNAAVLVLRRGRIPGYHPAWRMPLFPWLPLAGMVTSAFLIIDLGLAPSLFALGIGVVGTAWTRVALRGTRTEPGAIIAQLYRLRLGAGPSPEKLRELQPLAQDNAPETLADTRALRSQAGATVEDLRRTASEMLADAEGVEIVEAAAWLSSRRHLMAELDPGRYEIHAIGLDLDATEAVLVAWSPPLDDEVDREVDIEVAETVVVVIAGDARQLARMIRLAALCAELLCDAEVMDDWPQQDSDIGPYLAQHAALRQGAEPPPETSETSD